jgi:hypothetical protein
MESPSLKDIKKFYEVNLARRVVMTDPIYYSDTGTDLAEIRDKLLDSLLELPLTGFLRSAPRIITERQFETDEILHKAYYRFIPLPIKQFEDTGLYGLKTNERGNE